MGAQTIDLPTAGEKGAVVRYRTILGTLAVLALCACLGAGGAAAKSTRAQAGVTVYAAASLTDVFPAINKDNQYSFAGSNALATQITNGAPADVFASANTTIPAQLFAQGVVQKPVVFTRNTLVIVVPKSNPAHIDSIYDLAKPETKVVVAAPAVPVGAYTLQVLDQMGLRNAVSANFVSQETDVRTVLSKVQLGQADAGFVYSTDAKTVPNDVSVVKVPAWAQPKIAYAMAIVSKSPNKQAAQTFIDQVLSQQGQATMLKYGFLPISVPVPTIVKLSASKGKPGMKLTVSGTNFTGTTSVTFQGTPAKFVIVSENRLNVTVPKIVRGSKTASVTVTSPAGTATSRNSFTVIQ
jgi:molybdate transport system substrate-binding protein